MTANIVRHGSLHLKRKLKSKLEREGGEGDRFQRSKYVRKKQTLYIDISKFLIENELKNHHINKPLVSTKYFLIVSHNINTI